MNKVSVLKKHPARRYIKPLNINGLKGRILQAPSLDSSSDREFLLIYGHHGLLERWWGLVENLQKYGAVTMIDLPGFGGMDSFQTINQKPNLDAFADYLAAFFKMRYKRRRVTVVGISFGFVVATRMLLNYPELVSRVDRVISLVGFMHYDDFLFSERKRKLFVIGSKILAVRPIAWLVRRLALTSFGIKTVYVRTPGGKYRFREVGADRYRDLVDFEVHLWQTNDVRTHWFTTAEFLNINNCFGKIDLPLAHVAASGDQYFDGAIVEQHLKIVYKNVDIFEMKSASHTPSILGDSSELAVMLPSGLRKILSDDGKSPKTSEKPKKAKKAKKPKSKKQ